MVTTRISTPWSPTSRRRHRAGTCTTSSTASNSTNDVPQSAAMILFMNWKWNLSSNHHHNASLFPCTDMSSNLVHIFWLFVSLLVDSTNDWLSQFVWSPWLVDTVGVKTTSAGATSQNTYMHKIWITNIISHDNQLRRENYKGDVQKYWIYWVDIKACTRFRELPIEMLRNIWQNNRQAISATWDKPIYSQVSLPRKAWQGTLASYAFWPEHTANPTCPQELWSAERLSKEAAKKKKNVDPENDKH